VNLKRRDVLAVWLLVAAFVVTFAALALRRHAALATNAMDLGNVNQALWNTAHGDFLAFTNMAPVANRLALHVEPILLLLVPFYWLGLGSPQLLLVVQALVVGLGAWPLYWLAREALLPTPYSLLPTPYSLLLTPYSLLPLIFPAAYLLLPALEGAVMYDFHALALAPTFLLLAFYSMEKRRPGWFAVWALAAMACKEDMGLVVAMLGLYAGLVQRRWKWAGLSALAGVAWFGIAVFGIQPWFSPTGANVQMDRYAWLGRTPGAVLDTLLHHPELVWNHVWQQADLLAYLGGLAWPTGMLVLLNPPTWLPALPSLAINLLSDNPFSWRLDEFHYAAPIAPFVVISALYGARRGVRWLSRAWPASARYAWPVAGSLVLGASLVTHYGRGYSPLARPFQPAPVGTHSERAQALFNQVPDGAVLFAQSNLNPHLSSRRWVYQDAALLTRFPAGPGWPAPDTWLFDVSSLVNQDDFQRVVIQRLLDSGTVEVQAADDGLLLLRARPVAQPAAEVSSQLPPPFYDFARGEASEIAYPLAANFGDQLRLRGFDLHFNRAEEVQPVAYFEALHPLAEDYFVALYLLDEWGQPLGATTQDQPALVWQPTHRWAAGGLVKVTFNTLPWYTRPLTAYQLALGVMHGRDVWQPAARLLPQPDRNTPYAVRLPADGSLMEVARIRQSPLSGMPEGGPLLRQFQPVARQVPLNVSLAGQVRLIGYDLRPLTCATEDNPAAGPACQLGLVLYWQADQPLAISYKVFVHLIGPDHHLWAQRDQLPDAGAYDTRRWAPGEVVADRVQLDLPPAMPAGSYDLAIGLYQPDTSQRLPVVDRAGQPVDDKIALAGVVRLPPGR